MVFDSARREALIFKGDTWTLVSNCPGDLNCDGTFNGADIDPFFLALGDPGEYERQFPDCDILNGDICD